MPELAFYKNQLYQSVWTKWKMDNFCLLGLSGRWSLQILSLQTYAQEHKEH